MYAHDKEVRNRARDRWVTGEASLTQIARDLGVARGTILRWRVEDEWDGLRNEAEHEAHRKDVQELTEKREKFTQNCIQLWSWLHAQCFRRARQYDDLGLTMPFEEGERMARILLACQTGYYMALGVDPKEEAKHSEETRPRRVLIEYEPSGVFAEVGDAAAGSLAEDQAPPSE